MFKICDVKDRSEIDRIYQESLSSFPVCSTLRLSDTTNSGNFRDVHYYDGKSASIELPEYTLEFQRENISNLRNLLRNMTSVRMIDIINGRNNFDPANHLDSSALLTWICTHDITPELFYLLEEQLSDNGALGTCLQGSSHRIRQIYYAQKDL